MKKILALILILALTSLCLFGCFKSDNGGNNNNDNNGGSSDNGGGNEDNGDEPWSPDEEPDDNKGDNIDPDGWTSVK